MWDAKVDVRVTDGYYNKLTPLVSQQLLRVHSVVRSLRLRCLSFDGGKLIVLRDGEGPHSHNNDSSLRARAGLSWMRPGA
jgi:hypothetical protein